MLDKCKRVDEWRARRRNKLKDFDGGRMIREVSIHAVMNAVNSEGPEVLSRAGEEYWKDQDRHYFGIGAGSSANGMRNRWGKVSFKKVYSK